MKITSFDEFKDLARRGTFVPVCKEIVADLLTPVSAFLKIAEHADYAFLLESVEGGEHVARYSFIGGEPARVITIRGDAVSVRNGHAETLPAAGGNPLDVLRELMRAYRAVRVSGLPRFTGGLVGYLAYDIARCFEKIPATAHDDLQVPDAVLLLADALVAFDHVKHRLLVVAHAHIADDVAQAYADAVTRVEELTERLQASLTADGRRMTNDHRHLPSSVSRLRSTQSEKFLTQL